MCVWRCNYCVIRIRLYCTNDVQHGQRTFSLFNGTVTVSTCWYSCLGSRSTVFKALAMSEMVETWPSNDFGRIPSVSTPCFRRNSKRFRISLRPPDAVAFWKKKKVVWEGQTC